MKKLIKIGNSNNIPTEEWYCESEEEAEDIDAPVGSIVIILSESGELIVKMRHTTGWKKI